MDATKAAALGIIPLDQMYLGAIVATVADLKLGTVLQDLGNDAGRLWLVRDGSTVPQAFVNFAFRKDSVAFEVNTRDERKLFSEIRYAEGIDAYLEELAKFLQANMLAAPKSRRAA